jgi:hypothetical protein
VKGSGCHVLGDAAKLTYYDIFSWQSAILWLVFEKGTGGLLDLETIAIQQRE